MGNGKVTRCWLLDRIECDLLLLQPVNVVSTIKLKEIEDFQKMF